MIKLVKVTLSFGARKLLDRQDFMLGDEDRVGLVGENGSGKSTLMKIMAGKMKPDQGSREVSKGLKIGYLPQEPLLHQGRTLKQELLTAFQPLLRLKQECQELEKKLESPGLSQEEKERLACRLAEALDEFARKGGYEMEGELRKVAAGLGFDEKDLTRPVESFSGGWHTRIELAKILLSRPHTLLLDEPTNHLDLEARNWLEDFLRAGNFSYLIVSHDRWFLDVTVDRIVEIEDGKLSDYRGNYSFYLEEKEKRIELARKAYEKQQAEIERQKAFIAKYRADKKRAGQVQARIKKLEKMEPVPPPPPGRKTLNFKFPPPPRGPLEMLRLSGIRKSYDGREVLQAADLVLTRGEKVAVVGPNGAGKSTLLKIAAGVMEPDSGERTLGPGASIAYYGQDAARRLDPSLTALSELEKEAPLDMHPRLRALLAAFLFSGEDVDKKVSALSGGEKCRLALAKLLLKPANLLILDEPTNHLDLRAKDVLFQALMQYQGAILFVVHDRYFLEHLPQRIVEIQNHKTRDYLGNYSDYLRAKAKEITKKQSPLQSMTKSSQDRPPANKKQRKEQRKREKELKRQLAKKQKKLTELEREIEEMEREIKRITSLMESPETASDYLRLSELDEEKQNLEQKLKQRLAQWESLENELMTGSVSSSSPGDH